MTETASTRFRTHPRVVHETIDGEVILIQIETGFYYSLGGSGAEIWNLLQGGHSSEEIARALEHRFDGAPEGLHDQIVGLAEQLREEGLLEPAADGARPEDLPGPNGSVRTAFAEPVLERYEDMQDFLLVDPIHEVDDSGWPNKKPA